MRRPLHRGAVDAGEVGAQEAAALLRGAGRRLVWLDGGVGGGIEPPSVGDDLAARPRHLVFFDPLLLLRVQAGAPGRVELVGAGRATTIDAGAFAVLATLARGWSDTGARLAGFLGYELAAEIEELERFAAADLPLPDMHVALYDRWLELDVEGWTLCAAHGWIGRAQLEELAAAWETDLMAGASGSSAKPALSATPATPATPAPLAPSARFATRAPSATSRATALPSSLPPAAETRGIANRRPTLRSFPDEAGYRAAVRRTVRRIHVGEIFQTNLCRRLEDRLSRGDEWSLYTQMRSSNPAAYGAYIELDGSEGPQDPRGRGAVLSMSPECFLSCRRGVVESRPIKGTRRRTGGEAEDLAAAQALMTSAKDRAELAMIVDLVRNDLGRVCRTGTVRVVDHARLLRLPTLLHTESVVQGRLRADVGPVELLRATFPPGSITGAPKIEAINVAAREEERRRGPAMGAIGWIDLGGDVELSVAIRTAAVAGERLVYHAGCGIVADSDPDSELEESEHKALAFVRALECVEA